MENNSKEIRVILTARDSGDRLSEKEKVEFRTDDSGIENNVVNIYEDVTYQTIEGFGGAFTEAGSVTLGKLSPEKRREAINAYFDRKCGLGYSLCRTHINSCDFSLGNYTYVEDDDESLKTFSIERDRKELIPFIRSAISARGSDLKVFASPWSPPAWMKTNNMMNRGGRLKDEYRLAWAEYYARYVRAYAQEGIKIWGITVQNEPKAAAIWDSCVYTAEEERDFVRDYLGPTFEKEGLGDIKIIIWDHNKERVYERAGIILSDPSAAEYIWGIGFHWYSGDHFEGLDAVHVKFPDKKLIFTEGCQEGGVKPGTWLTGERYGHDIIGDLNNWTTGWVDWNMLLDETGGPNHVGNYCDAPIIADTLNDRLIYESSYYYLGHFSRYILPGAVRTGFSRFTDKLEITAFRNPDASIVVAIMNRQDENIPFNLRLRNHVAGFESRPHSIMTLII